MKKIAFAGLLFLLLPVASSSSNELIPPQQQVASASPVITIPVMANAPGRLGGVFKTKVVGFNPTVSSFPTPMSMIQPPTGDDSRIDGGRWQLDPSRSPQLGFRRLSSVETCERCLLLCRGGQQHVERRNLYPNGEPRALTCLPKQSRRATQSSRSPALARN